MTTEAELDEETNAEQIELSRACAFRLGALEIRPSILMVTFPDGRQAPLEPRVMQVLVALQDADGEVVTRQMLTARCWEGRAVSEDAISRCIQRLRRLAEETDAFTIETVPKVGYRLTAGADTRRPVTSAPSAVAHGASICVLPFANMSDDPQQGYFSDGITEDIITDLSKVSSLFVVARTTAFAVRDKGLSVPEIAAQLGVTHVLEGSVRKSQGHLRITAQLIDGASGGHLWAERYDREMKDIFALQDELAGAVVKALKLKLLPGEAQALQQRGTSNLVAYELYLTARRIHLRGEEAEGQKLETIVRLCRRATDLDSDFARAWVLMGFAQNKLRDANNGEGGVGEAGDGGVAAAQRALMLDPNLADARALHARHLWELNLVEEALAEIDVALRLDPEAWAAHSVAATINYGLRRFETAIVHWEKAVASPESTSGDAGMLMSTYRAVGDQEGVMRAARIVLERAEMVLARDDVNAFARCCGMSAVAALGQEVRARDLMERGLLLDPDNIRMRYNFACGMVTYMHDHEGAIDVLAPVFPRFTVKWVRHARTDPDFDPLRSNPRFQTMMAEAEARVRSAGELD
jgi:adenylate cyclase